MLYLSSYIRQYIYFAVHQCGRFTYNTKALHDNIVNRIFCYLQGTNKKVIVLNLFKITVMECSAGANFFEDEGTYESSRSYFVLKAEIYLW